MLDILFILSRVLAGVAGAFFLCCSLFLYEDAEKRIQNRLEEIWVRINDLQRTAMSKEVAFLQGATRTTTAILDRLLGHKLLSWQAVAVSMEFSLASYFIWYASKIAVPIEERGFMVFWALFLFVVGSLSAFANGSTLRVLRPILERKSYYLGLILLTLWLVYAVMIPLQLDLTPKSWWGWSVGSLEVALLLRIILPGILIDIFFIAYFRWILKRVARLSRLLVITLYLGHVSIIVALLAAPAIVDPYISLFQTLRSRLPIGVKHFVGYMVHVCATNLVDGLCLLLLIVVMLLLLAHRLIWPLIERPIYSASRRQLIKNSKLLFTFGTLLLLYAVPNYGVVKWLTRF